MGYKGGKIINEIDKVRKFLSSLLDRGLYKGGRATARVIRRFALRGVTSKFSLRVEGVRSEVKLKMVTTPTLHALKLFIKHLFLSSDVNYISFSCRFPLIFYSLFFL